MKLSYPPLIVLGCIAVQILLNMLVPLEVNLSLLLGLIVLILSLGIITYAFRELNNNAHIRKVCAQNRGLSA